MPAEIFIYDFPAAAQLSFEVMNLYYFVLLKPCATSSVNLSLNLKTTDAKLVSQL